MKQLELTTKNMIITGNILFVICCIFYLAWWLLAFRPEHGLKGWKTGWLLIPATIAGVTGICILIKEIVRVKGEHNLIPMSVILIGGMICYIMLLLVTNRFFHRPVTTELFLIVGWTMLELCLINTFLALGVQSSRQAVIMVVVTFIMLIINMVCYTLYYKLDQKAGYIDGIIPLAFVGIMSAVNAVIVAI